jgi:hypothetical protein
MIILIVFFFALFFSIQSIRGIIQETLNTELELGIAWIQIFFYTLTCILRTWFYYLTH